MGRISVTGFVGFGVFVFVCLWGGVTEKKFPPLVYLAKSDGRHRKHLCNDNLYLFILFFFTREENKVGRNKISCPKKQKFIPFNPKLL